MRYDLRRMFVVAVAVLLMVGKAGNAMGGSSCSTTSANGATAESPYYFNGVAKHLKASNGGTYGGSITKAEAETYHTIIDHTQADHAKVMVSNTETDITKNYPLMAAKPNPWAAINYDSLRSDLGQNPASPAGQVKYVEVKINNAELRNAGLTTETNNTKGVWSATLTNNTYLHRLGSWNGGPTVTPLQDASGQPLQILDLFDPNNGFGGQAFDLDRIRYAANKLWAKWKSDVLAGTDDPATDWYSKFGYQPTGTMSFEQYVDNIANERPMFGIVRVIIPVSAGKAKFRSGYRTNCVNGNEFLPANASSCRSTSHSNFTTKVDANPLGSTYWGGGSCPEQDSKKIIIYGMLMYDYVTDASYRPWEFGDSAQDYTDNNTAGTKNKIANGIYMKVYESILINPTNDHFKVSSPSNTYISGEDYRMDSLENARYHMIKGTLPAREEISDAAKFEYLMRKAVRLGVSPPSGYYSGYDFRAEKYPAGAAALSEFASDWAAMKPKDKFHLLFPSGYERGWMIAMDALDMTPADWANLPTKAATTVGSANVSSGSPATYQVAWVSKDPLLNKSDYPPFEVPAQTLDINPYDGTTQYQGSPAVTDTDPTPNPIPNVFTKQWEDFPGLSFAGGVLDMHAHANISGMLYTPDSGEIEAKKEKYAAFQYVNGAILIRHGVWFEDGCKPGDSCHFSLIAVSFNPYAFDRLRTAPRVGIHRATNWRELKGQ